MAVDVYWEDLSPGRVIDIGTYRISRDEIVEFARRYDPQPFHTDDEAAKRSIYGGLIASGWHTCAAMMRLLYDAVLARSASLGSPGMEEIRWLKPVRPDDVLRGRVTVVEARASDSRADRGIIKLKWEAFNQHDERVLTMRSVALYGRRPASGSAK